jgi:hypothetical protein
MSKRSTTASKWITNLKKVCSRRGDDEKHLRTDSLSPFEFERWPKCIRSVKQEMFMGPK